MQTAVIRQLGHRIDLQLDGILNDIKSRSVQGISIGLINSSHFNCRCFIFHSISKNCKYHAENELHTAISFICFSAIRTNKHSNEILIEIRLEVRQQQQRVSKAAEKWAAKKNEKKKKKKCEEIIAKEISCASVYFSFHLTAIISRRIQLLSCL